MKCKRYRLEPKSEEAEDESERLTYRRSRRIWGKEEILPPKNIF